MTTRQGRFYYLEVVMGGKFDPCSKNTWALNMKSQVFLSPTHLLLISMSTWGCLVMTLPSEIILLQWEGQETAYYHYSIEKDINFIAEVK
jgi:hypothetical protein